MQTIRPISWFLLLAAFWGAPSLALAQAQVQALPPIFRFEANEFWLNLHSFLHVLGRAAAKMPNADRDAVRNASVDAERGAATLTSSERQTWTAAVADYAGGLSRQDPVFDPASAAIVIALTGADDAASLSGVALDMRTRDMLERVASIYRKMWWPSHRAANEALVQRTQALVDRHGKTILDYVTRAYGQPWPADGYAVHVSYYAHWAGNYSTDGYTLVMSSNANPTNEGALPLEIAFHEGMHQWDDQIASALAALAKAPGVAVPNDLPHALIWATAGEAVRRVAPDYVPFADAFGNWRRMRPQGLKAALEEVWTPYLNGRGTRDEALAAILARVATPVAK
jgi:hypothetical protein